MNEVAITVAVLVGGWFALIGSLFLFGLIDSSRELRTLARFQCPSCNARYGQATARRSKARYESECNSASRRIHADAKEGEFIDINFTFEWPVECAQCGHQVYYDTIDRKLVAVNEQSSEFAR